MDPTALPITRSSDIAFDSLQFNEEIERLISPQTPESGTSFTALLEFPPTQDVDPSGSQSTLSVSSRNSYFHSTTSDDGPPTNFISLGLSSKVPALPGKKVKDEAVVTESVTKSNSSLQPVVSKMEMECKGRRPAKRKEREPQKGKGLLKKIKCESSQEAEILPYVHVRARRGQATDSHSLAERARREKINARMKLLQELVPGCSKISGTALVLDEIINHVQSLQQQVELLSMKLAAVNPRMDFRLNTIFDPEMGFLLGNSFPSLITPPIWLDDQVTGNEEQQRTFNTSYQTIWGKDFEAQNLMNSEVSLLSSHSSANAMTLRSDPLKIEL